MEKTTQRKMVTIAMLVSILLVAIDTTIVTTAMPHIVQQLSGLNLLSWVFAIYLLTSSVTAPIYGKLADLFGRKSIFIFGISLFVIGSMVSGMAQTMYTMNQKGIGPRLIKIHTKRYITRNNMQKYYKNLRSG